MAIKPELKQAVAYNKIKATDYNSNFNTLLDYIEDISEELTLKVNTINSQLSSNVLSSLQSVYPVGSIYIGVTETCPIANLFGTWEKIAEGLCLQGATGSQVPGETVEAGLPNIKGVQPLVWAAVASTHSTTSALYSDSSVKSTRAAGSAATGNAMGFDASRYNAIYGKSDTVQPPAYVVNIWKRTA